MLYYENAISKLEQGEKDLEKDSLLMNSDGIIDRCFPKGTLRRKVARAFYLLLTDVSEFKQRFTAFLKRFSSSSQVESHNDTVFSEVSCPFPFPESKLAHKYCVGRGLEIGGSAHNPFGLNTLNVDFTDSMDTVYKKEEVKFCGRALNVDVVAYGDDIPLPNGSQDFIVSSHVIEHFPDPIKALLEWDRLIKPGGIIFMIVPHKERTFDKDKECTSLEHLIHDYESNNREFHGISNGHDHCWITETFVELICYMIEQMQMKWRIEEVQNVDDKVRNGFTVVIRKIW